MALSVSLLFSAINVQTASKDELMCIKGIGDKKADAIIKYRKSNKLKSADDLINIKGLGKVIIQNVKNNVKSVACGGKKSAKKSTSKKTSSKKSSSKDSSDKKASTKKSKSEKSLTKASKKDSSKETSDKKSETEK